MEEVFINQEVDPYALEADGTLDLAALQLQPGTIVIKVVSHNIQAWKQKLANCYWPIAWFLCSHKGLVDVQTRKTKRTFADIQQKVLHDTTAGSMASPLH